jgi:voltage-gated potassium channel
MLNNIRRRVFEILDVANIGDRASRVFDIALAGLILANVVGVIVPTTRELSAGEQQFWSLLERVSIGLFTLEFLLRLWSCTEDGSGRYRATARGRLRYLLTPLMVLDLLAILPYYLGFSARMDLRFLRLFRLVSILKITQYSPALTIMATVVKREGKTLIAAFLLLAVLLFSTSTVIYFLERDAQPGAFASILHAMWWGMATLTTVGYGDIVPLTAGGKVFGVFVMFIGIGVFAIPTGILVSGFYHEIKRKDFHATWNMVARVPSFSRLDALEVSRIADLLHVRTAMPDETIFRKGDPVDCMYFIVAGEIEVDLGARQVHLSGGDFFGEVSLLYKTRRTASVKARTYVELLQLDGRDLEAMLETNEVLSGRIMFEAEKRSEQPYEPE